MTVHFRHPNNDGPHNGQWKARVSYLSTSETPGPLDTLEDQRLIPRDANGENNFANPEVKSFYICDDLVHDTIKSNEGIITSHQGYGQTLKMDPDRKVTNCEVTLESENKRNIQLKFNDLKVATFGSINDECDSESAHISIIDETAESQEPNLK